MQNQDSHFRKPWPQGVIDDSTGDAEVLDMFNEPEKKEEKKKTPENFSYEFDEEVVDTANHLNAAEKKIGK